ncbi:MAG: DUF4271 domain-containing protein [Ferruginibacter sp.]
MQFCAIGQSQDSVFHKKDSIDFYSPSEEIPVFTLTSLLNDNHILNSKSTPVSLAQIIKKKEDKNIFFYLLAALVLLLGIARTTYPRYFSNIFRVFFNSSLRQSQLTDQLSQDKLPSLIFNILFVILAGLYFYLLTTYLLLTGSLHFTRPPTTGYLLSLCVGAFAVIYFVKFMALKFTGWITGYKQEADIYTFIVFLINKIIAICLLPIVIVMAFSEQEVAGIFILISFILIGAMLLMRFFKSYGLLQHRLKVSRFHFFLYIFSVEVLPLFLIYKGVMFFFVIKS